MTITTEAAETKIHLHPPLTEAREVQLLNFHKPAFWFKFERPHEIKQVRELLLHKQQIYSLRRNSTLTTIITIPEGYYTLDSLREQVVREQYYFQKSKFKIKRNSEGYYFTSKVDLMLDRGFYKQLGLPEVINKDKFYELKSLPNKPVFFFCDTINSHNSYTGFEISGEAKLKPSNLLAVLPSENYPSLEVENSCLPLNQIILRVEDEKGVKPQFNETFLFSLKIS